ncbi:MAG: hypothetical protein H6970_06805 [Gammaproteobacteria bacterium]|nr:hypothetical protein [Gammaproteobacteria bacterium]MCP5459201.1 hypothetical protein [Gammaproteobacteria bacterium]
MKNSIIKFATAFSIVVLCSLSGQSGVISSAHAAGPWWKCPSGQYKLETIPNQNKARCVKAGGQVRVQPDAGCPVGTVLATDHSGNTDYCLPATGTVLGKKFTAKCKTGEQVQRRHGRDRCYKNSPADYAPVSTPG